MSIRNLEALFQPRSVAVIGASRSPKAVGHLVVKNLIEGGFDGPVLPVNPKADAIRGVLAYPSVEALPVDPDLAVIATPARTVPEIVRALGERGAKAAIVLSAGFGEAGEGGRALQAEMLDAARPHLLRILGPNCVGALRPAAGLNASFAHRAARRGGLGFLSQSGAVITTVLDWAAGRGVGFSMMASMGGMADVDFGDMIDALARDPETRAILLYAEQITNAAKFMSAARAAARVKPVIVVKPGRHAEAAQAAFSHTGALAGADAVYDAAFRRAGMVRVNTLDELFDAAEILDRTLDWRGERLAILTNGGGAGVLAVDALMDEGGRLAELAPETVEALDDSLPATWSRANPVDIIGDAPGARYAAALRALEADADVDAVLAINCPTAVADSVEAADAVLEARGVKPLIACWLGEDAARPARARFEAAGAPVYDTPARAVRAFSLLAAHRRNLAALDEAPQRSLIVDDAAVEAARALVAEAREAGRDRLGESEAKRLLDLFGVPVVPTRDVATPEEAAEAAEALGFPAALKIVSPDIVHKSDAGGVVLNLTDADAVRAAAEAMLERLGESRPDAALQGFAVQPMASMPGAHELIAGVAADPVFGPVVLFGQGGTAVEVIGDTALALPPLNRTLVDELMARTQVTRLLKGYRDRKPADLGAVAEVLIRLGDLAAAVPEVKELDINPLWANADGVLALDARVRLQDAAAAAPLAVAPWPRRLAGEAPDGAGGTMRVAPVAPGDARALARLLKAAGLTAPAFPPLVGEETDPDRAAARLAQIDYRRQMVMVARRDGDGADGDGDLLAAAAFAADPDLDCARAAAILPADAPEARRAAIRDALEAAAEAMGVGRLDW